MGIVLDVMYRAQSMAWSTTSHRSRGRLQAATAPTIAGTATTQAMGRPWGDEVRISPMTALMKLLGPHDAAS